MKLSVFCLIITVFLTFSQANSQRFNANEDYYNRLIGGFILGANATQVDGSGYDGYNKWGISGGGILYLTLDDIDLPFPGTIAFSLEVLYNQKGAIGRGLIKSGVTSQVIDMHYAEIPIQVNLFRGTRKSNFGMGAAVGYLGFVEEVIENQSGVTLKDGYPFKKWDLSFVITGNLHLWNGFYFSPRFQYSMISIRNNNSRFGGRNEQFNNIWSLRLMYMFK